MDRAEYLDRIICNQQIQCVIELDGRLDERRLARAARLVMDAEPVLGCRFVERKSYPFWERRDDLDDLQISDVQECGAAYVPARIDDFLKVPGDPRVDPLVRLKLLRAETDTLCVKVDHIAADTGGTKDVLYLLCEIYRHLISEEDYEPRPNSRGDRRLCQALKKVSLPDKVASLRHGNPPVPDWGFPFRGKGSDDWAFAVRRTTAAEFRALKESTSSLGMTNNDCVLAAYYRAFFEAARPGAGARCTIRVPIDLRRYLPGEMAGAVCNLSGQLYPVLEMIPGEELEGTLVRVHDAMEVLKEKAPGIGAAMVVAAFTAPGQWLTAAVYKRMVAREARAGKCDPYLSNMGVLSEDGLRFGHVVVRDAWLVSPLQWAPGFLMGVSTFNERMTVTVGYADAAANAPVVEEFLDHVTGDLGALQ
jgi:NRPS condensation-like uncharacterized protein